MVRELTETELETLEKIEEETRKHLEKLGFSEKYSYKVAFMCSAVVTCYIAAKDEMGSEKGAFLLGTKTMFTEYFINEVLVPSSRERDPAQGYVL